MFKTKKKVLFVVILIATVSFTLGFVTSQNMQKTDWIGYLVHGVITQEDMPIVPEPDGYAPKVDGKVVIGLREDGVVVWKHVADSAK